MTANNLHLISLNVQGLREKSKRLRLNQWIIQQQTDIAFLQETHFTNDVIKTLNIDFEDWSLYHSFGTTNCNGVSILISKKLDSSVIDVISDPNGRYLFMNIETHNNTFSLLNIYAPNDKPSRTVFFRDINLFLIEHSSMT